MKFCRTFSALLWGGRSLYTGFTPCAVFCHPFRVICHCLIDKQLIIQEQQIILACRGGEEHAGDVLRALIKLHTQQVACPTEVVFLRELCLALENEVIPLSSRTLQHQQAQFILLRQNLLWNFRKRLLVIFLRGKIVTMKVNVHAHSSGHPDGTFQRTILIRHARVIHLQQTMLRLLITISNCIDDVLLFGRITQLQVFVTIRDRTHHLRALIIIYCIATHSRCY